MERTDGVNLDNGPFVDWWSSAAPTREERLLVEKVFDCEEYFDDMRFEAGTVTHDLIRCQSLHSKTGEWIDDEVARPDELAYFDPSCLKYKVEKLDDALGYYNHREQLLCVSPEGLARDGTVLHEMIHVYEGIINDLPLYFHDMLLWGLYGSLKPRIPKLDAIVSDHAHLLTGSSIYQRGGLHDIVFLLKSFDLDIRMKYPLGTVFEYGRTDDFRECEYV